MTDVGESPTGEETKNKTKKARVLPNLQFVEGDMSEVTIEQGAFVASVHGRSQSFLSRRCTEGGACSTHV